MIQSLTSKRRFFELFIKNKNLIKQGLYLLEICQRRGWIDGHLDESSWLRRTVMDSVVPYLMKFLLLLSSLPSTASRTDRHRHNHPSRVFVPKQWNSWNMGTEITSLNFMTNLHDGSSWLRRSVTFFRNSTLGQTSPSFFSSCTTLPPTDRHKHDRLS